MIKLPTAVALLLLLCPDGSGGKGGGSSDSRDCSDGRFLVGAS